MGGNVILKKKRKKEHLFKKIISPSKLDQNSGMRPTWINNGSDEI